MHMTKLGISVGLVGAFICFLGLFFDITNWFFIVLIALVLWQEDNTWLRKLVIKVAIISLILLLIPYAVDMVKSIVELFKHNFNNISDSSAECFDFFIDKTSRSAHIDFYIDRIVLIIRTLIFTILGINSLKQKHVSIKPIDNIINKNI